MSQSSKHSNLQAAKSALGLTSTPTDAPSTSTTASSPKRPAAAGGGGSVHSRDSQKSATHTLQSTKTIDSSSAHSASTKRSSLHDLSLAARAEARRFSVEEALEEDRLRLVRRQQQQQQRGSLTSSPNTRSPTRRNSSTPSINSEDNTLTLEEGSRDDSMAASSWTAQSSVLSRAQQQQQQRAVPMRFQQERTILESGEWNDNSNNNNNNSSAMMSSSNFGMSSSFNNVYEKKVSFNHHHQGAVPVSQEFDTSPTMGGGGGSHSTKKVSFNREQDDVHIVDRRGDEELEASLDTFDQDQVAYSNEDINNNDSSSQLLDQYALAEYDESQQSLISTSSANFVPQRFDEMRSLLLNITPLQLEALVHEIFSNTASSNSYLSVGNSSNGETSSRSIPPEWKGIRKKSKRFHFRKDAYLGEMDFQELQNFARSIELWSIVENNEGCADFEEAMDIFAIEFEMLVSGYQNRSGGGSVMDDSAASSQQQRSVEEDIHSYFRSNSAEEGENLRISLRACSVPELRLVAERLNLDHSVCGKSKGDLILLIERSMADMVLNGSVRSGNSHESFRLNPPPPPPRHFDRLHSGDGDNAAMYVEESHAQQQQEELEYDRSRRVKFSTDCKQDTSHLIPKRAPNQAVWGNYVVDGPEDIENGQDSQPLMYDDEEDGDLNRESRAKRRVQWPEQRRKFIIVGSFVSVIVGLALGLGLGLTKEQWQNDGSASSSNILTGPWTFGTGNNDFWKSSDMPSTSPSEITPPQNVVVILNSTKQSNAPSKKPTRKPTSIPKPTADVTKVPTTGPIISEPYNSGGISSIEIITNSPALSGIIDNDGEDFALASSSSTPTMTPVNAVSPTNAPTDAPISLSPTLQPTAVATDPLHPLLGPFDETGMKMVAYGITTLSSMGQTQWKMLTSAFIEQFYNHGDKGGDAIQNVVDDLSADIEITDQELIGSALVITFTATISYHTKSAFLDSSMVADRPFTDEAMRSNYVDYLMTNNGVTYIGNITSISEVFHGDVPAELLPSLNEDDVTSEPTDTMPSLHRDDTPIPTSALTPEPSTEMINNVLTPRPTLLTPGLSPQPTINSFDYFDFVGNTLSPVAGENTPAPSSTNTLQTFPPVGGGGRDDTPFPTSNAFDWPDETPSPSSVNATDVTILTPATNSAVYTDSPTETYIATLSPTTTMTTLEPTLSPSTPRPTASPKKRRTPPPTSQKPTTPPSNAPTSDPTDSPSQSPTPNPTSSPVSSPKLCNLLPDGENCEDLVEVAWEGFFEVAQTHVVKAVGENRRAPRMIAHREAELLFTPEKTRRLEENPNVEIYPARSIEYVGDVYIEESGAYVKNELANTLLDATDSIFILDSSDADIVVDLKHLRLIENISILLPEHLVIGDVRIGLRYDDGQDTDEQNEMFNYPDNGWLWHDVGSSSEYEDARITLSVYKRKARYISIQFNGCQSKYSNTCSLQRIEIVGYLDGLGNHQNMQKVPPEVRSIEPRTESRTFIPSKTTPVRIAVYSANGSLLGVIDGRDPSKQRAIFESKVSESDIDPYSDAAWSATLPFTWVEEGNVVMIGCIDSSRPSEVLVHRLELNDLAQFSEHSITRTKMALFGTDEDVLKLNPATFDSRKLVRNLHAVMPVSELKWADTDLWHLTYLVVIGKDGKPALVTSEEERRSVTGVGTEIQWEVMKNFLTIRHALAQAGLGFALTGKEGSNSPYASHTSVFMGWSLSKQDDDGSWHWEDLGYWDTLAAAAWTGWVAMKAGDECSNYFIHELGHAQSMQHFDNGVAKSWGIEDEYPSGDGVYTPNLPWGFDSVSRQFRTWFDPLDGSGKKDPLNGEGEPPYSQELNCFSQYTPYQAEISQEWAMSTPVLLSSSSSDVPRDGAYQFNAARKEYTPLVGSDLADAAGEHAMTPDQVSIPIVTLIGTIGASRDVCQTYPALRGWGNTFKFPDPFETGLSSAFNGASYFVELRFESGRKVRSLIAVKDVSDLSMYSFNIAIDQRPIAVDLYRFVDGSYPNLTSQTQTQLLHIRPIELPPEDPLQGMPRQLRAGRGWLGDSSSPLLSEFCISTADCEADRHDIEWRGNVGSDYVMYRSTLQGRNDDGLKATVFKVPALRQNDSNQYIITVLAARFFNDREGMSPLLTSDPLTGEGSSSIDVTHVIRIWAPWELNSSLPGGTYRSLPDSFKISADVVASGNTSFQHNIIEFNVGCYIGTVTAAPTFAPTKRPSEGPSRSPVQVRYHIDWKHGTCVTEGESSSWAPPYKTKEECCKAHMGYEYNVCLSREA